MLPGSCLLFPPSGWSDSGIRWIYDILEQHRGYSSKKLPGSINRFDSQNVGKLRILSLHAIPQWKFVGLSGFGSFRRAPTGKVFITGFESAKQMAPPKTAINQLRSPQTNQADQYQNGLCFIFHRIDVWHIY